MYRLASIYSTSGGRKGGEEDAEEEEVRRKWEKEGVQYMAAAMVKGSVSREEIVVVG